MATSVIKRHLAARVGYKDGRGVYAFACAGREDGLEKHLAVRVGYLDGRAVYAFTSCLPAWPKTLAARGGYKDGRAVYLYSGDCCEPAGDSTSSSSSSVGAGDTRPRTTCCGVGLLDTMVATITGSCTCMNQSITLTKQTYAPYSDCLWSGNAAVNSTCSGCASSFDTICVFIYCPTGSSGAITDLRMQITLQAAPGDCVHGIGGCGGGSGLTPDSTSTSPFSLVFNRPALNSPCGAAFDVTITE